jgi:CubicO group peptidase (beta-lactamase class C family)
MRNLHLAATILLCGATDAAAAETSVVHGATAAKIDAVLAAAVPSGFGGAVLVEKDGEILLKAGYGFADRQAKTPFTVDTIAQIGSITKSMTAIAILQLAEEGKLDLKAPAKTYLPGAAEPAGSATLHLLLTHHAGLADTCGDDFDSVSKADLLHRCMAIALAHPAGEDHYSNMAYSILAAIVEQVSGERWQDYLRAHVWGPLAMKRTGFDSFAGTAPRDFSLGYLNDKPQPVISGEIAKLVGNDWDIKGNGGVQASTMDMEHYWRGLTRQVPAISPFVIAGMTTPQEHLDGEAWEGYGLAVRLGADGKPYRIGFSGSDGTFFSYFGMLPTRNIFIYIVGNNGEDKVHPLVSTVLKTVLVDEGLMPAPKAN